MRKLSLIFLFVLMLATSAAAQTSFARRSFKEGTRLAQSGHYEKALESYRQALAKNDQTTAAFLAKIHFNIGVCLYRSKRADEALEEFQQAIELSGGNYQKAFYALGMAHAELKNPPAAETAFRAALKLETADGEAWFDLALVLLEEKNFGAAREAFQNAIKYKSAAAADAHNNLGVIFALNGDVSAAENEFETALRVSGGKSVEAQKNLQFCKSKREGASQNTLARLEFSRF